LRRGEEGGGGGMTGKKKPIEKKIIKQKPRHPRPDKDIHWRERREEKPSYKRKRKQEKEIDKDLLSE
jgi:hypothetical protein